MKTSTSYTRTATIYVGLRYRYSGEVTPKATALAAIQAYVNEVGLCVTVTDTEYIYTNGSEPGLAIGLINYPRFPSSLAQLKAHAMKLAEILLATCKQLKVTVVLPSQTIMLEADNITARFNQ